MSKRRESSSQLGLAAIARTVLAIGLIGMHGFDAILRAALSAHWGVLWVTIFHVVPLWLSAIAWFSLLRATWRAPLWVFLWARWIREVVDGLLPVAQSRRRGGASAPILIALVLAQRWGAFSALERLFERLA